MEPGRRFGGRALKGVHLHQRCLCGRFLNLMYSINHQNCNNRGVKGVGFYLNNCLIIKTLASKFNINVNRTLILPDFYREDYKETFYQGFVQSTKDKTRIYVFIGENVALLDLMSFLGDLHDKGALNLDDYIVLAVDNSIDDSMVDDNANTECHQFIAPPWSKVIYGSHSKRLARLYRSVLRIVPATKDFRAKK